MSETLDRRLEQEPVKVECPLCRHRQWLDATPGRCDQCGSEIEVFADRRAAKAALDDLRDQGRIAYRIEVSGGPGEGLWAVVANRRFPDSASR